MKVRCSTTTISAIVLSLCLVTSIPTALIYASTWKEHTIRLPLGAIWNLLASLGFTDLGIVIIGLIVLWTGYRKRERWAWFVMLIALMFFYFPTSVLPVLLQIRQFGGPYLQYLLGAFRLDGWLTCSIASMRPNYAIGLACIPVLTMIGPLRFLLMLLALLLPVKAFFWKPLPRQPGMPMKFMMQLGKQPLVWVLALLLVIAVAVAIMVRPLIASSQNTRADIQQLYAELYRPYMMVFVDLAKAEHPVAMPGAGMDDAIVVALTRDGSVYLGLNRVDAAQLAIKLRETRTDRTGITMYLRADRRAKYRDVENTIDDMRSGGSEVVGLITQRRENTPPDSTLWIGNPLFKSVGLEISFPYQPATPSKGLSLPENAIVVHVIHRPNAAPAYKINAADVAHADLHSRLNEIFANRAERVLFIKGDDDLNFYDIADVIDIARTSSVDHIGLLTPGRPDLSGKN